MKSVFFRAGASQHEVQVEDKGDHVCLSFEFAGCKWQSEVAKPFVWPEQGYFFAENNFIGSGRDGMINSAFRLKAGQVEFYFLAKGIELARETT